MTAKTFLTISSIFTILYGLSFLLVPGQSIAMYGTDPEPRLTLICRFLGSALLAFGIVQWFNKEFRDWDAIRAVLIAIAVLNALNLLVNLWGTMQGLFNAMAWSTTIVSAIFLAGALYCLSAEARKLGSV
jgi:uncharacterized membrane protein